MSDTVPLPKPRYRPGPFLLLFLAVFLCFAGITGHDLWNPDEPRVCCIAMNMQRTREWAVPRLAGEIFIEKPPLYLWLCGLCGRLFSPLFGVVGGARLSTSFCAVGTLAATAWLAFLLRGRRRDALFAVLVLSTMPQFLLDMHRMRTDVLLAFCTAAAVACLAHAYLRRRPWFLLPAGIAAAGAFLSKGPIGWILLLPAALPLALQAWLRDRTGSAPPPSPGRRLPWMAAHATAILLALGLAGLWVWTIFRRDDPAAWNAWLWDNQIGRTTGSATALGHHHPWAIHYYLVHLPAVLGPWFPHLLLWLAGGIRALRAAPLRGRCRALLQSPAFFLAVWGFGGLLLLTVPSTKRGIYLLPLYPAFALMATAAIPRATHMLFGWWSRVFAPAPYLLAAGLLLLPALAPLLPASVPAPLVRWSPCHAGILLIAFLYAACARFGGTARPPAERSAVSLFLANAFIWLLVFGVPFQARDARESMREPVLRIAAALPPDTSRVASYRLDETGRAVLEFYAGIVLEPLDTPRDGKNRQIPELAAATIADILSGRHPRFSCILAQVQDSRDIVWPRSAEVASALFDGASHCVLSARPGASSPDGMALAGEGGSCRRGGRDGDGHGEAGAGDDEDRGGDGPGEGAR